MQLVGALTSGIRGAENGTASLFVRGTSAKASYWLDFEATLQVTSGADLQLDANGSVEVYVNQPVDIVARDAGGTTVRSFTDGGGAGAVEVVSQSFTGVDYASGATAAQEPTTLSAIMNLWLTNAGAIDWKVLVGSTATTLRSFASSVGGLYINVKDSAYGATGNGVSDDTAAIQAALTAASTNGATVVFPPGTYLVSAALLCTCGTSLLGTGGRSATTIKLSHATANTLSVTANAGKLTSISGLTFSLATANSGYQLTSATATDVVVRECLFTNNSQTNTGRQVDAGGPVTLFKVDFITGPSAANSVYAALGVTAFGCTTTVTAGAYSASAWHLTTGGTVVACTFDLSAVTSGSHYALRLESLSSTAANAAIANSFFGAAVGTTTVSIQRATAFGNRRGASVVFAYTGQTSNTTFSNSYSLDMERTYRQVDLFAASTYTIPDDTGTLVLNYTNAGNTPTLTLPSFEIGKRWRLVFHNNRAANLVGLAWDFGTSGAESLVQGSGSGGGTLAAFTANTYTVFDFQALYVNLKNVWFGSISAYDVAEP
jgi:hypothetical protein